MSASVTHQLKRKEEEVGHHTYLRLLQEEATGRRVDLIADEGDQFFYLVLIGNLEHREDIPARKFQP